MAQKGKVEGAEGVPVRIHSECFTGDVRGMEPPAQHKDILDRCGYTQYSVGSFLSPLATIWQVRMLCEFISLVLSHDFAIRD